MAPASKAGEAQALEGSTPKRCTRWQWARRVLEDQLVCKTDVHRTEWVRSPPRPLVRKLGVSSNGKTVGLHPANEGSTLSTVHCSCMARWWNWQTRGPQKAVPTGREGSTPSLATDPFRGRSRAGQRALNAPMLVRLQPPELATVPDERSIQTC